MTDLTHISTPSAEFDQGCAHSPCGVAAAVGPISRLILSDTHRMFDSGAKLWTYLDDWYIWIKPQYIQAARAPPEPSISIFSAQQNPDLDRMMLAHHSVRIPGQGQTHTEMPGRPSPHGGRQQWWPRGAGRPTHHENRHATPPKHFSYLAPTQPSRSQYANGLSSHVRGGGLSARLAHDLRPRG